jgi:hypothetical protein
MKNNTSPRPDVATRLTGRIISDREQSAPPQLKPGASGLRGAPVTRKRIVILSLVAVALAVPADALTAGDVLDRGTGTGGSRIPGVGLNRFAVGGGPIKAAVPDPRS